MADMSADLVRVGYMVDDVEEAVYSYTKAHGSTLRRSAAPAFAEVVGGPGGLLLEDRSGNVVELFETVSR